MLISGKGRYAITAMMNLAISDKEGPVSLADISQSQGISLSYLEQIFSRLRKQGLVQGTRGRRGGYCLGRPAEKISMGDIVRAVEEHDTEDSLIEEGHAFPPSSPVTPLWNNLQRQLYHFLDGVNLAHSITESGYPGVIMPNIAPVQGEELKYS